MAEPIEMPFGFLAWTGPRNHILDEGPDPPIAMGQLCGGRAAHFKYRDVLP